MLLLLQHHAYCSSSTVPRLMPKAVSLVWCSWSFYFGALEGLAVIDLIILLVEALIFSNTWVYQTMYCNSNINCYRDHQCCISDIKEIMVYVMLPHETGQSLTYTRHRDVTDLSCSYSWSVSQLINTIFNIIYAHFFLNICRLSVVQLVSIGEPHLF